MSSTQSFGFTFADASAIAVADRSTTLGGKGSALVRMTELGLAVPPGFIFTTDACKSFLAGGWNDELERALDAGVQSIANTLQRGLGSAQSPLLVSVRSGAPISMPGMMDTVLNAGMND